MFDRFQKTLDRELGPAGEDAGRPPVRDPWLRDWPLLLGLVLSAALIGGSTTLGSSQAEPAGAAPAKAAAAAGAGVPGEVVDVGESETPAVEPVLTGKAAKPKKSAAKKSKSSSSTAAPAADAESTGDAGQDAGGSSSGGSSSGGSSSPGKRSGRSGGSTAPSAPAKPGRIVNVTGTSAAITNGPFAYTFSAPTHTPAVGSRWRLAVGVKRSGAPLTGTVKIDILHQGTIVGHAASGKLQGGRFAHDFDWPERSIGHPLTVKTTIIAGGLQQSFLFSVAVKKAG